VASALRRRSAALGVRAAFGALLSLFLLAACTTTPEPPPGGVKPTKPGRTRHGTGPSRTPQTPGARTDPSSVTATGRQNAGTVLTVSIPGGSSGFVARDAVVYLPPIATSDRHVHLPVLELLHGEPGGPRDWVDKGGARATLDGFAAAHDGYAPIVVMPDINGTDRGDTECVSTAAGDVEQYLTQQVPDYVQAHFPAATGRPHLSIAGNSEGGMCALMLAVRHPDRYASFADLSGLTRPTVGETDDPPRTVARLFAGSRSAYDEHDPIRLLGERSGMSLAGWLRCGSADTRTCNAQQQVVAAADAAGLRVDSGELAGGHVWSVWQTALGRLLPWLWPRITT
jgi:S-formylglutathione hydrolase FrmB